MTGVVIIDVMIDQRYDIIVFAAVVITSTAFSLIGIFKSGILDKKEGIEEEDKKEEVTPQSE
jgi:hypothetical protein